MELFWLVGAAMGAAAAITSVAHRVRADHQREHRHLTDLMGSQQEQLYRLQRRVAVLRKQARHRVLPAAERRHHVDG